MTFLATAFGFAACLAASLSAQSIEPPQGTSTGPVVRARITWFDRTPAADVGLRLVGDTLPLALRTDHDGTVVLRDLAPLVYQLEAGDGLPYGFSVPFTFDGKRDLDLGEFAIPRLGAIVGRVIDPSGGPIEGARVVLGSAEVVADPDAPDAPPSVITKADGRFELVGVLPRQHEVFTIHSDWSDGRSIFIDVAPGARVDIGDLRVYRGSIVRGRVVDPNGAPVANARVARFDCSYFARPIVWRTTRTGMDGEFELRAFGYPRNLRVDADGLESALIVDADRQPQPLVVRMKPQLTLHGRVLGTAGRVAKLTLDEFDGSRARKPPATARWFLSEPFTSDVDGAFAIVGLPAADYEITAEVDGVGRVGPVALELRENSLPLELRLRQFVEVQLTVADADGVPLAGVEVADDHGLREQSRASFDYEIAGDTARVLRRMLSNRRHLDSTKLRTTDSSGRATLHPEPGKRLVFGLSRAGYVTTVSHFAADTWPTSLTVRLARAGALHGKLNDTRFLDACRIRVALDRSGEPTVFADIDASGSFAIDDIEPGDYEVRLSFDNTAERTYGFWRTHYPWSFKRPIPLLGDQVQSDLLATVSVRAGEMATLELRDSGLRALSGTVSYLGKPIAGAGVFHPSAMRDDESDPIAPMFRRLFSSDSQPHTTTDADGRYRMLYAKPGEYLVNVAHPRAVALGEDTVVRIEDGELEHEHDFELTGATIEGSVAVPSGLMAGERLGVRLYSLNESPADPYFCTDYRAPRTLHHEFIPLDGEGRFEIAVVPPGEWVLRVDTEHGSYGEDDFPPRRVTTQADETVRMGRIVPAKRVQIDVPCAFSNPPAVALGGWIRLRDGNVFVSTAWLREDRLAMQLEPGRYEIELFEPYDLDYLAWGMSGQSTGARAEFVVHSDGNVDPATLSF